MAHKCDVQALDHEINSQKLKLIFQWELHQILPTTARNCVPEDVFSCTIVPNFSAGDFRYMFPQWGWTRRLSETRKFLDQRFLLWNGPVGIRTRNLFLAREALYRWATGPGFLQSYIMNIKKEDRETMKLLSLPFSIMFPLVKKEKRRWSIRRFPYGYLVTT